MDDLRRIQLLVLRCFDAWTLPPPPPNFIEVLLDKLDDSDDAEGAVIAARPLVAAWHGPSQRNPYGTDESAVRPWSVGALALAPRTHKHAAVTGEDFLTLYSNYWTRLVSYCASIAGAWQAEDIAQEVMLRVLSNFDRLDRDRNPWPFLCVVAKRLATDSVRASSRLISVDPDRLEDLVDPSPDVTFEGASASTDRELLVRAFRELPPVERVVLYLSYFRDLTSAEIAGLLGVSASTVRHRLVRARHHLTRIVQSVELRH